MDGYTTDLFNNTYEWERDELEDIIWEQFNDNAFVELACFLPQLTKYDGNSALREKLSECVMPSRESRIIARTLYDSTGEDSYLDIFKKNSKFMRGLQKGLKILGE